MLARPYLSTIMSWISAIGAASGALSVTLGYVFKFLLTSLVLLVLMHLRIS